MARQAGQTSAQIKKRINIARERQKIRYQGSSYQNNSQIPASDMDKCCKINNEIREIASKVLANLQLSARGYSRTLKVSRTIADLEGADHIELHHFTEALQYRFS